MNRSWQEIIGHQKNIDRLRHLAERGKVPHALLFYGAEGIGKRKVAEVLAVAVLCQGAKPPCGSCPSCRALAESSHPDYFLVEPEVRGKSTRIIRIEQIRQMETEISRLPALSEKRAVIIDDAQQMNEQAANCLLKTLEEPTGEVVFILIAPSRESLLPTIVSRCTPISFGILKNSEVAAILRERGVSEVEAEEIAALAGGSAGKAVSLIGESRELFQSAMRLLAELRGMDLEKLLSEESRLAELERQGVAEWLRYLKLIFRDLLALAAGGTSVMHRESAGELAALLAIWDERRLFAAMELVTAFERRITRSNASIGLQLTALLLRLQEIVEED